MNLILLTVFDEGNNGIVEKRVDVERNAKITW